jgi:hypothetical protein
LRVPFGIVETDTAGAADVPVSLGTVVTAPATVVTVSVVAAGAPEKEHPTNARLIAPRARIRFN